MAMVMSVSQVYTPASRTPWDRNLSWKLQGRGWQGSEWYQLVLTCVEVSLGNPGNHKVEAKKKCLEELWCRMGRELAVPLGALSGASRDWAWPPAVYEPHRPLCLCKGFHENKVQNYKASSCSIASPIRNTDVQYISDSWVTWSCLFSWAFSCVFTYKARQWTSRP